VCDISKLSLVSSISLCYKVILKFQD
jgi:hypothetical protein